ncbi:MAG: sigma factor [Mesorhizobium sp.]|nr:sigma factor [Mesorhizobium sp.]
MSHAEIEAAYRSQSRRVLATLIRLLGDFDRAEDALADAFAAAAEQWPREGVPRNPFAWLVSTGRFKAIDRIRKSARQRNLADELALIADDAIPGPDAMDEEAIADDQLRLIFTCCHPALGAEAQVALTLREVGGLTTEQVAAAFLVSAPTMAQRIVRAKARIRDERIPYRTPDRHELPDRLEHVLRVIYLIFNEAYAASSGEAVVRVDLAAEAIRLGRLLVSLLPDSEALGLLALMLLQDSRRAARSAADGSLILFEDQDRSLWNHAGIAEGKRLAARAFAGGEVGAYAIQAAIAAEHAAAIGRGVDWHRVVALYDMLLLAQPSPTVELNRAAAIGMRDGPEAGIRLIDALLARDELTTYQPAHVARGELLRRAGRRAEAKGAFAHASRLAGSEAVGRFIARRLGELG